MSRFMRSAALAVAISAMAATGGAAQQTGPSGDGWFGGVLEVTCDVVGVEGVQVLTTYGVARRDRDALTTAVRNAVLAIVFRGVQTSICTVPPLFRPADMNQEADRYFGRMFAPGGNYLSYVSFAGDQVESRMRVGRDVKVGTTVAVDARRLRADLEAAGVLRTLADPFRRP